MKRNTTILIAVLSVLVPSFTLAAESDLLTGDKKLACEATLCLSSGTRPSECSPSLKRYFSIHAKKPSDTIKQRINFLNLCPTNSESNMRPLVNAIANGAGRCDANELNRINKRTKNVQQCKKVGLWGNEKQCTTVKITYILNSKPAYCTAYEQHELTSGVNSNVRYIGTPEQGGRWVDK